MITRRNQAKSRSERVRQRREKNKKKRVLKTRVNRAVARSMPSVVVRPKPVVRPEYRRSVVAKRSAGVLTRKRHSAARRQRVKRIVFGWRSVSVVMSILLVGLLNYVWRAPAYRVQNINFEGLQMLSPQELELALKVNHASVFSLSPQRMQEMLTTSFVEINQVDVQVRLPNMVKITVQERTPALAWQREDEMVWVASDGVVFMPRGQANLPITIKALGAPPDLPPDVNSPNTPLHLLTPKMVLAIQTLQTVAPDGVTLLYHPEHGLGWEDPRGWQVFLGMDTDTFSIKYQTYQAIMEQLKLQKLKPALISLEHLYAPFYQMER